MSKKLREKKGSKPTQDGRQIMPKWVAKKEPRAIQKQTFSGWCGFLDFWRMPLAKYQFLGARTVWKWRPEREKNEEKCYPEECCDINEICRPKSVRKQLNSTWKSTQIWAQKATPKKHCILEKWLGLGVGWWSPGKGVGGRVNPPPGPKKIKNEKDWLN